MSQGRAVDQSTTCQEPGCTAGGEQRWASERSFIYRSPSLPIVHITAEPLPAPSMEKLSSTKPVPGAKNGDRCLRGQTRPVAPLAATFLLPPSSKLSPIPHVLLGSYCKFFVSPPTASLHPQTLQARRAGISFPWEQPSATDTWELEDECLSGDNPDVSYTSSHQFPARLHPHCPQRQLPQQCILEWLLAFPPHFPSPLHVLPRSSHK